MASNGPDPGEFLDRAQRMLRELFGEQRSSEDPWAESTRRREPSGQERRENLGFALATRAVEALEDLSLNVAAIRQRLERTDPRTEPRDEAPDPERDEQRAEERDEGGAGTA